jgi:alcohol dehydrogenase
MVLGHEASGEVVECGPGATRLKPGDHVVSSLLNGGTRLKDNNLRNLNHHLGVSAFAEYAILSKHSLIKITPEIPYHVAALFGCAVLTGMGTVVNTSKLTTGQTANGNYLNDMELLQAEKLAYPDSKFLNLHQWDKKG